MRTFLTAGFQHAHSTVEKKNVSFVFLGRIFFRNQTIEFDIQVLMYIFTNALVGSKNSFFLAALSRKSQG